MPETRDAQAEVEALFRRESAALVSAVVRIVRDLDAAEEIVQETLLAALVRFRASGVPENAGAWAMVTARNRALDHVRHKSVVAASEEALSAEMALMRGTETPTEIPDDRLRLVFTCCHPDIPAEGRVALTLRMVGGLTTAEIARAFLVSEPTIAQRIVRAKRFVREAGLPYEVPEGPELRERLPSVLEVTYLVFNEGYVAGTGAALVRQGLCDEALRLGALLVERLPTEESALGLLALMELQASRATTRANEAGELVLLADQDRTRWDRARIARGLSLLTRVHELGSERGVYALQADIAACHAVAETFAATDWRRMESIYAELEAIAPSPVVALNRAVAVSMVDGPAAGLARLDALANEGALRGYHHLHAARADLLRQLGRLADAAAAYRAALALAQNDRERAFLTRRLAECEEPRA